MSDNRVQQLLNLMKQKQNEIHEWSRAEMIRELEQVGVGSREADRVISLAADRGLLGTRPVGRGKRIRYFIKVTEAKVKKTLTKPKNKKYRKAQKLQ